MKKSMLVVLVVMLLALFPMSGNAAVVSNDPRTLVLSNELGPAGLQGGLIDQLIAAGYGSYIIFIRYCSFWRLSRAAAFRRTLWRR